MKASKINNVYNPMKKNLKTIGSWAMMSFTALVVSCNTQTTSMEQQIDELYQKMPQEERIAQLKSMYMDELFDEQGKLDTAKCRELIPYGIGHFSQFCMQQPRDRSGRIVQPRVG